jgi:hypothetical protein
VSCGHDGWQDGCPDCEREHALAAARLEHRPFSWSDRPGFYDDPAPPTPATPQEPTP